MKKVFAFISILAVACAAMFAEVTAKKLADGKVEATFFYGNPRATEVLLAGSFTDWQNGALPMEKGDKGFTLTKVFDAGTTVKYKFISDGNWTTDLKAPDFIDDGFGGKNSCADLDELAGGADAGAAPKSGLKFQTWSNFGFQDKFATTKFSGKEYESDFDETNAGINLKSYWKFGGDVVPHVPVYVEIAFAENDSFNNLYNKGSVDWDDGLKNWATDMLFDTIYALDANAAVDTTNKDNQKKTYLGHFKTGVTTGWVDFTAGYGYAKLTPHYNANWNTLDQDWEAGYQHAGGFNQFATGALFKEWFSNKTDGNVELEVILAPNRSVDRAGNQYGFYGIVDATLFSKHYVDFQYNAAYGNTYDTLDENTWTADYIFGYKGTFGPAMVKANFLVNDYHKVDVDDKQDLTALNVNATYSTDFITANLGYRYRGYNAWMMYVEEGADDHDHITDQLGDPNTQRIFGDVSVNVTDSVNVGLNMYADMTFNKDSASIFANEDTVKLVPRARATVKLSDTMTIDGYGEINYVTKDEDRFLQGDKVNALIFTQGGLHFNAKLDGAVKSVDVIYGYDGTNDGAAYGNANIGQEIAAHNLLCTVEVPYGINVQAGMGLRTAYDTDVELLKDTGINPFGFSLGAFKQICKKYNTILCAQFCYNFDPYNDFGDGWSKYKLDGYRLDRDQNYFSNASAVRVGLQFDF